MPDVTLEIPDGMRDIVRSGLENSAATLRQAIDKALNAPVLQAGDDLIVWSGLVVWLDRAAGQLR